MNNDGMKYKTQGKIDSKRENSPHSILLGYVTKPSPVVLDVGCACGDLGIALKEYKGATVFGLEYSNDSVAIAKATGAYADVRQCNLDSFSAEDVEEWNGKFDYIICGDVLEHLRNPVRVVAELMKLLKPGGGIIASIPNIAHMYVIAQLLANRFPYTPCGLLDETHIHFFTSESIVEMLSQLGLLAKECRFTMCGMNEFNGLNPWRGVPDKAKKAIFSRWSSYVCQYVFYAVRSDAAMERLKAENEKVMTLSKANAPDYILDQRRKLLPSFGRRLTKPFRLLKKNMRKVSRFLKFVRDPSTYQLPDCPDRSLSDKYEQAVKVGGLLSREAIRCVYMMSGRKPDALCKYLIYGRWYNSRRSHCLRKAPPIHTRSWRT